MPRRAVAEFVDRNKVTVEDYLWKWLKDHALEVKPRTSAGYAHIIRVYVAPRIGRMRLQASRRPTSRDCTATSRRAEGLGDKPLAARTVEYVHAVIRKALADAVNNDQILTTTRP